VTELVRTRAEIGKLPRSGPVVLVPTMGALHDGHRALLRAARAVPDACVVVSVFVNPLQFGPGEDLDRYPRTLEADLVMCEAEGADLVFAPSAAEMYPAGQPRVTVDPGPAGRVLEGEFRPGFFGGVLTVVLKLFSLVRPDIAVFGQKDAQQLALIRAMVTDLDLGLSVTGVPTVRDPDGLAMSSRNRYLSAAERTTALTLSRALRAGVAAAAGGPAAVLAAAQPVLAAAPGLRVDYLALVDRDTFASIDGSAEGPAGRTGPAVLAVAARVGATRLIDNMLIDDLPIDGPVDGAGGPHAADH
jgi:pantoate--beta-alanine ligase